MKYMLLIFLVFFSQISFAHNCTIAILEGSGADYWYSETDYNTRKEIVKLFEDRGYTLRGFSQTETDPDINVFNYGWIDTSYSWGYSAGYELKSSIALNGEFVTYVHYSWMMSPSNSDQMRQFNLNAFKNSIQFLPYSILSNNFRSR